MSDTRDKIRNHEETFTKLQPVEVPAWGVTVYMKGQTARERDKGEQELSEFQKDGKGNLRARVVAKYVLESDGSRMFTDDDAEWLGEKQAPVIDLLFSRALVNLGMSREQQEDTLKNS